MGDKIFALLLLSVWLFCGENLVALSRELTNDEDRELENQLKLLNKPAITTIWTRYGEEYDCVDFYKQRAFDHLALKNHNFHPQMRPSLNVTQILHKHSSRTHQSFNDIWLNCNGCPSGSVPMKRVTKDDLIRIKLAENIYGQTYELTTPREQGTHYAVLRTNSGTGIEFYGAGMVTSIYNPQVNGTQYSSSQVTINNGVDTIEAGWTVNPSLYNDGQTRLFIHTRAGTIHCFNTYCPGFVSVSKDIPLGIILAPVSQRGGKIYSTHFLIHKDARGWWLKFALNNVPIGFWPETIFTSLNQFASHVEWGGKVYSPPNIPSPPMGAGHKDILYSLKYDAYCDEITVIDKSNKTFRLTNTNTYADIKHYQIGEGIFDNGRRIIEFGGIGGYTGN